MSTPATPACSVVVPVYNEQGNAAPLCAEIREVMRVIGRPFEMIFVNDGSSDGTLAELRQIAAGEPRLRILDLDGNFGEAAALSAGFQAARGDLVITMDGDGQNDPHDIPQLLETLERNGYRVVSGWRQQRQEGLLLRVLPSRIANGLIAAVSGIPVHDNGCGLKIYRRPVVERAALPRGWNRFLPAILGVRAEEVAEVPVNDRRRQHGQSHYGIGRTVVVIRDLLALRFIIANPRRAEPAWALVAMAAALSFVLALWRASGWLLGVSVAVGTIALLIWRNLRRFNHAQRRGVFRVRREYTGNESLTWPSSESGSLFPRERVRARG
jgi:glycosyltransferase involved in cell wall biosynthesis